MSDLGTDSKAVFAANGRLYRQVQQLTDENFILRDLLSKVVLEEAVLGRISLPTLDKIKTILKGDC